jgi:hypothetical protein
LLTKSLGETDTYTIREYRERYSGVGKWGGSGCKEGVKGPTGVDPRRKEMRKKRWRTKQVKRLQQATKQNRMERKRVKSSQKRENRKKDK